MNSQSDDYLRKDYPIEGRTRGWRFRVGEISANVYKVEGSDGRGRSVTRTGTDPDRLIEACEADAREIGGGRAHPDIQPPIFVIEGGDVSVYASLEEATNGLEGIDVADGIYTMFDSVGKRIRIRAEGVRRGRFVVDVGTVHVDAIEDSSEGPAELRRALLEYARRLGRTDLDSGDLHRLVEAISRSGFQSGAISQPSAHVSAGYLRRLWRGEVGLPVTYWIWGVLVNLLLRVLVVIVALVTNSLSVERGLVLLYLAFSLFMCVAIWRSAGLYTGRRIWGDLARVSLLLVLIVRLARVFLGE